MERFGLRYAYRNRAYESGWTGDELYDWVAAYVANATGSGWGWLRDGCVGAAFSRAHCGEIAGFYNNFFVAHVPTFRGACASRFLAAMDDSGRAAPAFLFSVSRAGRARPGQASSRAAGTTS